MNGIFWNIASTQTNPIMAWLDVIFLQELGRFDVFQVLAKFLQSSSKFLHTNILNLIWTLSWRCRRGKISPLLVSTKSVQARPHLLATHTTPKSLVPREFPQFLLSSSFYEEFGKLEKKNHRAQMIKKLAIITLGRQKCITGGNNYTSSAKGYDSAYDLIYFWGIIYLTLNR